MTPHNSASLQGNREDPGPCSALGSMAGGEAADEKGLDWSLLMPRSEPHTVLQESQLFSLAPSGADKWEGMSAT